MKVGDKIRYWQPDAAGILAAWNGKTGGGGEVVTTTVTEIKDDGYIVAADGTFLARSDLR